MHFKMQPPQHVSLNTSACISLAKIQYPFTDFNVKFTYGKNVQMLRVCLLSFFDLLNFHNVCICVTLTPMKI